MQCSLEYFDDQQKTLLFEMEDEIRQAVNDVNHKVEILLLFFVE